MKNRMFSQKNVGILLMALGALQLIAYLWKLVEVQMVDALRILVGIALLVLILVLLVWNRFRAQEKTKLYVSVINTVAAILFIILLVANAFLEDKQPFLSFLGSLLSYSFPFIIGMYLYLQSRDSSE